MNIAGLKDNRVVIKSLILLFLLLTMFTPLGAETRKITSSLTAIWEPKGEDGITTEVKLNWSLSKPINKIIFNTKISQKIIGDKLYLDGKSYTRDQLGDYFDKITLMESSTVVRISIMDGVYPLGDAVLGHWALGYGHEADDKFPVDNSVLKIAFENNQLSLMHLKIEEMEFDLSNVRFYVRKLEKETAKKEQIKNLYTKADQAFANKDYDAAEKSYNEILKIEPDESVAEQRIGEISEIEKQMTEDAGEGEVSSVPDGGQSSGQTANSSDSRAAPQSPPRPPTPTPEDDWAARYEENIRKMEAYQKSFDEAMDEMNQGFDEIARKMERDRQWSAASRLDTSGRSPDELIRQVEQKKRILEQQADERRAEMNREMDELTQQEMAKADNAGSVLLVQGARILANELIKNGKRNAQKKLDEQLEDAFEDFQEEILEDIEKNRDAAKRGRAETLLIEEFDYFNDVVDYYEEYESKAKNDFSIRNTNWMSPSGNLSQAPRVASQPNFTTNSLASFLDDKYKLAISDDEYARDALRSLDKLTVWGIDQFPESPESYFYRSLITKDALDRYLFSNYADKLGNDRRYTSQADKDLDLLSGRFFQAIESYDTSFMKRVREVGLVMTLNSSTGEGAYLYAVRRNTRSLDYLLSFESADQRASLIQSLLIIAVGESRNDAVDILVKKGASVHSRDTASGMTPVQVAASSAHLDIIELLDKKYGVEAQKAFMDSHQKGFTTARYYIAEYLMREALKGDNPSIIRDVVRYELNIIKAVYQRDMSYIGYAVANNKTRVLQYLLESGVSPLSSDFQGEPLIVIAMENSSSDAVFRILTEEGASLFSTDKEGRTPMHWTAVQKRSELTLYFLEQGAPLNVKDVNGQTPLISAVIGSEPEIIKGILAKNPQTLSTDKQGRMALHYAVLSLSDLLFSELLESSLNVDIYDQDSMSPLHIALESGEIEKSKMLLERKPNINASDNRGRTYLLLATAFASDLIDTVLSMEPDINAMDSDGNTALHIAAASGNVPAVIVYTKYGADTSIINKMGDSPVHIAIRQENPAWPSLLKSAEIVQLSDREGNTAIHLLLDKGWGVVLSLLVRYRPDINQINVNGQSYLHLAALSNNYVAVDTLLQLGADPNIADNEGNTPLHLAAAIDALESSILLLEADADKKNKNRDGDTALKLAYKKGDSETGDFIWAYGRR
jgi:ankyrin repeat protein